MIRTILKYTWLPVVVTATSAILVALVASMPNVLAAIIFAACVVVLGVLGARLWGAGVDD